MGTVDLHKCARCSGRSHQRTKPVNTVKRSCFRAGADALSAGAAWSACSTTSAWVASAFAGATVALRPEWREWCSDLLPSRAICWTAFRESVARSIHFSMCVLPARVDAVACCEARLPLLPVASAARSNHHLTRPPMRTPMRTLVQTLVRTLVTWLQVQVGVLKVPGPVKACPAAVGGLFARNSVPPLSAMSTPSASTNGPAGDSLRPTMTW